MGSLLGTSSSAGGGELVASGSSGEGSSRLQGLVHGLIGAAGEGDEAAYVACRSALEAAMDEADQRAHWQRFRVHV